MRDADNLGRALANAPTRELRARLVRRVPMLAMLGSIPLDFLFTSGIAYRYNPRGVECLYFAETEATAAAEYDRHNRGLFQPVTTYFADVQLRRVLDLCEADSRTGISYCGSWQKMQANTWTTFWIRFCRPRFIVKTQRHID